jgi:hypothetical protein
VNTRFNLLRADANGKQRVVTEGLSVQFSHFNDLTVDTTPIQLLDPNPERVFWWIKNMGDEIIRWSFRTIDIAASGFPISPGETYMDYHYKYCIYLVADGGTQTFHYAESEPFSNPELVTCL